MLIEHALTRLHIAELEKALDQYRESLKAVYKLNILSEAAGYANLLQCHIDKGNRVVPMRKKARGCTGWAGVLSKGNAPAFYATFYLTMG